MTSVVTVVPFVDDVGGVDLDLEHIATRGYTGDVDPLAVEPAVVDVGPAGADALNSQVGNCAGRGRRTGRMVEIDQTEGRFVPAGDDGTRPCRAVDSRRTREVVAWHAEYEVGVADRIAEEEIACRSSASRCWKRAACAARCRRRSLKHGATVLAEVLVSISSEPQLVRVYAQVSRLPSPTDRPRAFDGSGVDAFVAGADAPALESEGDRAHRESEPVDEFPPRAAGERSDATRGGPRRSKAPAVPVLPADEGGGDVAERLLRAAADVHRDLAVLTAEMLQSPLKLAASPSRLRGW